MMKNLFVLLSTVCCVVLSCTKEKTDYEMLTDEAVSGDGEYAEALNINSGIYIIRIESINGAFYRGYNDIRLKMEDSETHQLVSPSKVLFLPLVHSKDGDLIAVPHQMEMAERSDKGIFLSYAVFLEGSDVGEPCQLYISYTIEGKTEMVEADIVVKTQNNKNLGINSFTGKDSEQYLIALMSPKSPEIGENELVAGIYKLSSSSTTSSESFPDLRWFAYHTVDHHILQLDPRMPEPSMGNHSSPNNRDLTQEDDSLYYGVVNYTMTGNWTLNFILWNQHGENLKGNVVPTDFTPGVEGVKSELHIDISF